MKSTWIAIYAIIAVAALLLTQAQSADPEIATPPPVNPMRDQEAGQIRDDNVLTMKVVWCPPGAFFMGSPKSEIGRVTHEDQVEVTFQDGFWLGKFEVTQSDWFRVMKTEPWKPFAEVKDTFGNVKEGAEFPATCIRWADAIAFCRRLTDHERKAGRLPSSWEYTLPSEAQWEYACRAQSQTKFSFGEDKSKLDEYAWFIGNSRAPGERHAHRVGLKKPNPWGLCDMHGNVWEWCRDVFTDELPGGRDPEVTPDGAGSPYHVVRGGGWYYTANDCRSASRGPCDSWPGYVWQGFRVALAPLR